MSQSCTIYSQKNGFPDVAALLKKTEAGEFLLENETAKLKTAAGNLRITLRKSARPGDEFSHLLLGTHNFFNQIETENAETQQNLANFILSCRTAVGIVAEPAFTEEDTRLDLVFEIAELLDGIIFNGSEMLNQRGELILGADGISETTL